MQQEVSWSLHSFDKLQLTNCDLNLYMEGCIMIITSKIQMDLNRYAAAPMIHAVQDDRYSRNVELALFSDGNAWVIPEPATVLIRYSKPDGTGGEYDSLPDHSCAYSIKEHILTVALAPQVLTVPGAVRLSVILLQGQQQISTFSILICVEEAVNAIISESGDNSPGQHILTEPDDTDVPKVFFGAALPQTKNDTIMSFRYISKTKDIRGYCKTKAQGNSSMNYPKKNQTVKLYKDAGCTEKLMVDFKGWGPQSKFCFKANWIDLTHARNIVTARLWGDVVMSRANYTDLPDLLRTSPNQGAVDGFPVKVYANGIYQGRYTINIPKDAWMANMDADNESHCILCGESESAMFTTEAVIDGTDWSDEIHDTVPDAIKTRWNEAIRFVMNSTDEEFVAGIGNYFDVNSLIDYYLFALVACHFDGFHKNQLYMTYDGLKWYASAYDMDSTWGLWWDASKFVDYNYNIGMADQNRLYSRMKELFAEEMAARMEELRASVLSKENIINEFERFTDICPPWLCQEDYAETTAEGAFVGIPLTAENNIQQIRDFINKRHAHIDKLFAVPVYELTKETVLNGTDEYIYTDVSLNGVDEYTVLLDYTVNSLTATRHILLDNIDWSSGTRCGWAFEFNNSWPVGTIWVSGDATSVFQVNHNGTAIGLRNKIAMRRSADGRYTAYSYAKHGTTGVDVTEYITDGEIGHNVSIGAHAYSAGSTEYHLPVTIHGCEIYMSALSDAQIAAYLQGER